MNFANVKGLTIPQGKVTKIELLKDSMRTLLWQAIRYLKGYTIGGNAEVKVGRNLWDEEWELGTYLLSTGEPFGANDRIRCKNFIKVNPNTTYYCALYSTKVGANGYFCYYDASKTYIAYDGNPNHYKMNSAFTTPSNCEYVRFYLNIEYGTPYEQDVMLAEGSTAVPYEPYKARIVGVGDEFAWNQLVQNGDFSQGLQKWNAIGCSLSIDGNTATITRNDYIIIRNSGTSVVGHKYLFLLKYYNSQNVSTRMNVEIGGTSTNVANAIGWDEISVINTATSASHFGIYAYQGVSGDKIKGWLLFDLTAIEQAMGITISTLEDFKTYLKSHSMMDKDATEIPYFGYDAGSVKTSLPIVARSRNILNISNEEVQSEFYSNNQNYIDKRQLVDGNLWLGMACTASAIYYSPSGVEIEVGKNSFIITTTKLWYGPAVLKKISPSTDYYFKVSGSDIRTTIAWLDADGIIQDCVYAIQNSIKTSPDSAEWALVVFQPTTAGELSVSDICINLSDADNGKYTPYQPPITYPLVLSSPLYKVGSVADMAKFGEGVTRKMGKVKLKDIPYWSYNASFGGFIGNLDSTTQPSKVAYSAICAKYPFVGVYSNVQDFQSGYIFNRRLFVKDSSYGTDVNAFLASLTDEDIIIYELATPTTEAVDLPKIVDYQPTILTTDTEVQGNITIEE